MKKDRQTKNELIEELNSVRMKVKKMETLLEECKHAAPDITGRKRLKEESEASEEHYRSAYEKSHDGLLFVHRSKGHILHSNAHAQKLLGYSKDEFLKNNLWGIGVVKDDKDFQEALSRLERDGVIYYNNISAINKAGQIVNTEVVLIDKEKFIQCNIRDNTESKRVEEQLRQSEELFRLITENATDLIAVLDLEGKRIYSSPSYTSILGESELLRGTDSFQEIHPEDREKVRRIFLETVKTGIGQRVEYRFLLKDGSVRYVESQGSVIRDEKGNTIKVVVVSRDVTKRKLAEQELRESKALIEAVVESIPLMIFLKEATDLRFVVFNRAGEELLGYDRKDLLGKNNLDLFPPEQAAHFMAKDREVLDGETGILDIPEEPIMTAKKGQRLLHTRKICIKGSDGVTKYLLGISDDITERKQVEETTQRLAAIVESSDDAIIGKTLDGTITSWNYGAEKIYGYSAVEIVGRSISLLVPPEQKDELTNILNQIKQGLPTEHSDTIRVRKDGSRINVSITISPVHDGAGKIVGASTIARDITERKRTEKQITLLAHTLKSVAECVSITDLNDIVVFVNDAFLKTYGYTENEILDKNINIVRSPNNPSEAVRGILAATLAGGWNGEIMNRTKDGRDFPVSLSTSFVRDEQGQDIALVGIATDITERTRAEEELKKSEEKYRSIFENIQDVYYESLFDGTILEISPSIEFISKGQYHRADLIGRSMFDFYNDPKDRDAIIGAMQKTSSVTDFEVPIKNRDGSLIHCSISAKINYDAQGQPEKFIGSMHNISKRKQAEQAVRDSEKRFRAIFDQAPIALALLDMQGRPIVSNLRLSKMVGYTNDELSKMKFTDFTYPEDADKDLNRFIELTEGKISKYSMEKRYVHKNGNLIWVNLFVTMLRDENGVPQEIIGMAEDITERKRANASLVAETTRRRILFEQSPDGIVLIDPTTTQFIEFNTAAHQQLGYSRDEFSKLSLADVEAKETLEESRATIARVISERRVDFETLQRTKGDEIRNVYVTAQYIDISGHPVYHCIWRDITDRKRVEEELRETSDYLENLLSFANAPIMVWDKNNKITRFNLAFERMTGYTIYDVLGKNPEILFSDEKRKEISTLISRISDGENLISVELPVRCKNGIIRTVLWNTSNIYTKDAKTIIATIAHGQDITERKHAVEKLIIANKELVFQNEEKEKRAAELIIANKELVFQNEERKHAEDSLKDSELRFRSLYENATIGIYRTTPDGNILLANPALLKMLGYTSFEKLAERILEKDGFESSSQRNEFLEKIERDGEVSGYESTWTCQDGTDIFVLESARAIRDSHGKTLYYDGTVENITERKSLQNQILQTQKVQSIGTLAGGIAHDFNNILGIILAYTSVLERSGADEKKISKSTTAITQAVSRGTALVRQILTFARQTGASVKPMLIPDLIRELVVMLQETFPEVIEFKTTIEKNVPFINADQTQMHQVLLNLCVNARDAMPNGGIIGIEVKTVASETLIQQFPQAKSDRYVSIDVSDTGIGMDEATMGRIFDPFFTTKEQGKGTGLGLSVVYGVIQEHHGFISVESKVGQGTAFHLYLPVAEEEKINQGIQKISTEGTQGGSETILLVEDEELLREVVQSTLESNGYKVLIAADGREAVEIYKKQYKDIALVLSDMGLPKLGGIDVYATLKEINPNIKIIFASGFISLETRSELLKEGANGFIMKPYSINEVLHMVREVLDDKGENNEEHDFSH
jgi:two-component system cell cycle sensor histidine kinase/response regulator CckA